MVLIMVLLKVLVVHAASLDGSYVGRIQLGENLARQARLEIRQVPRPGDVKAKSIGVLTLANKQGDFDGTIKYSFSESFALNQDLVLQYERTAPTGSGREVFSLQVTPEGSGGVQVKMRSNVFTPGGKLLEGDFRLERAEA